MLSILRFLSIFKNTILHSTKTVLYRRLYNIAFLYIIKLSCQCVTCTNRFSNGSQFVLVQGHVVDVQLFTFTTDSELLFLATFTEISNSLPMHSETPECYGVLNIHFAQPGILLYQVAAKEYCWGQPSLLVEAQASGYLCLPSINHRWSHITPETWFAH